VFLLSNFGLGWICDARSTISAAGKTTLGSFGSMLFLLIHGKD
jgi:hypothetical protein